jgi:xanthine dehydrogenase/oxidase
MSNEWTKIFCGKCDTYHIIQQSEKKDLKCKSCGNLLKFKVDCNSQEKPRIAFVLNGQTFTVENEHPFDMTLNQYLRDFLNYTGTKVTCKEGGCGACLITAEIYDHESKQPKTVAINSCLYPLYSCDGLKMTTIEGIGSKTMGFNAIQKRLADNNGSQCGWCSAGMVMNMYSLLLKNPKPTKADIESSYDGSICRCTGYRPILEAMKSFAIDERPIDIEELATIKCLNDESKSCSHKSKCSSARKSCNGTCSSHVGKRVHIVKETNEWYSPKNMNDLIELLSEYKTARIRLVGGNTAIGVFKREGPYEVFID